MNDQDQIRYYQERYLEIPAEWIIPIFKIFDETLGFDFKEQSYKLMKEDGIHWFDIYHFTIGMKIRNLLRSYGYKDESLPLGNWDDYYVPLLENWIEMRQQMEETLDISGQERTWADLVRKHFPNATDEEIDFIMWEKTCFPFGTAERIEEQILEFKNELQR